MIDLGTTDISLIKLGSTEVIKAYLGETFVWACLTGVSISGSAVVNSTLTANTTPSEVASYCTYQWYSASSSSGTGTAISGATSRTFTPTISQFGKYLYVVASIGSVSVTSSRTSAVTDCVHTGSLYEMTSLSTPSPFVVTGYHPSGTMSGEYWHPFRTNATSCSQVMGGDQIYAEIDLGNNYKYVGITASASGRNASSGTGTGKLEVYYSDTNSWSTLRSTTGESVDGTYYASSSRPVRKVRLTSIYNSGTVMFTCYLNKCIVSRWQRV